MRDISYDVDYEHKGPATLGSTFGDPPRAIPSSEVTALMLQMLQLKPTDKLLEIGTGSASQTGAWSEHCKEVHTVELKPYNRCDSLGNHVFFREGDGKHGIPSEAPFDAIAVTCGTEQIYPAWRDQLAEGGRLVAPVGKPDIQRLTLFIKNAGIVLPAKVGGYVRFQMMEKA